MCMKRVPQIAVETPACTECHGATVMQRIQGKYGRELHRDIEPPIYGYSRRKV
jgi:hypothetical protein